MPSPYVPIPTNSIFITISRPLTDRIWFLGRLAGGSARDCGRGWVRARSEADSPTAGHPTHGAAGSRTGDPSRKEGRRTAGRGNIAAARLFYERAADIGLAQGAMRSRVRSTPRRLSISPSTPKLLCLNARRDFTGFRIFPNFAATLLLGSRRS